MKGRKALPVRVFAYSLVASLAACAPQVVTLDPDVNPAVSSAAMAQPLPYPPAPGVPGQGAMAPLPPLPVLRADFAARAGATSVQFQGDSHLLDDQARAILARQADWLRLNPMVRATIEGHADGRNTRDHALALGERRAFAVHSFLLAQGVSPDQLTVVSWGKERPLVEGAHEATFLQNGRVETVLSR